MPRRISSTALLAAALAGCGGGPAPGQLPPHGGTLVPLTGAEGFVEVVHDGPQLVVYFFDADRKPLPSAPSDVRLTLQGRAKKSLDLKPLSDPEKQGALAAAAPDEGDVSGMLTAKVGGKTASAAIHTR